MILLYELICKILDIGLRASVTLSTLWAPVTLITVQTEHSVHRSGSVRSDAIEHGSDRTRHHFDVSRSSRRNSITHRASIPLRHADPDELPPASMIRHRRSRSRSSSYTTLSLWDVIVVPPLVREGRRSHLRGGSTLPLLVLLLAALPLLPLENEKESSTSLKKKKKHSKSRSSNRDKCE